MAWQIVLSISRSEGLLIIFCILGVALSQRKDNDVILVLILLLLHKPPPGALLV